MAGKIKYGTIYDISGHTDHTRIQKWMNLRAGAKGLVDKKEERRRRGEERRTHSNVRRRKDGEKKRREK